MIINSKIQSILNLASVSKVHLLLIYRENNVEQDNTNKN